MISSKKTTWFQLIRLYGILVFSLIALNGIVLSGRADAAEHAVPGDVVPGIKANSYILMDGQSGNILAQRDALRKRAPASTTKIVTGIVALESENLYSQVKISSNAAETGEASINLDEGEVMTLEALLYGALLCSGNDACVAISEHIAGSVECFRILMNQKAFLVGVENSQFINPHGLPAKGHYSNAFDLAIMARYSLRNANFSKIVSTKFKVIENITPPRKRYLYNTNQLLWGTEGAGGVKTGTTIEAGPCLVAAVSKHNRMLITVVLKSNDRYGDTRRLLDYGFNKIDNLKQ
ncbi:MAG: D-alanyl-D-alanine carboxypeptidase family protein [Carboxydocellales bacterium]